MNNVSNPSYIAVSIKEPENQKICKHRPWLDKCEQKTTLLRDKLLSFFSEKERVESEHGKKTWKVVKKWTCISITAGLGIIGLSITPGTLLLVYVNHIKYLGPIGITCGALSGLSIIKKCVRPWSSKKQSEAEARINQEFHQQLGDNYQKLQEIGNSWRLNPNIAKAPPLKVIAQRLTDPEYLKHASLLFASTLQDPENSYEKERKERFGDLTEDSFFFKNILNLMLEEHTHESILLQMRSTHTQPVVDEVEKTHIIKKENANRSAVITRNDSNPEIFFS